MPAQNDRMPSQEIQMMAFYRTLINHMFKQANDEGNYDYQSDMDRLLKLLETARKNGFASNIEGQIFNSMGAICGIVGNYHEAQSYFYMAYEAYYGHGNIRGAQVALNNFAMSKHTEGDYDASIEAFRRVYEAAESTGQLPLITTFNGIISVYYVQQRFTDIDAVASVLERYHEQYYAEEPDTFRSHMPTFYSYMGRVALRRQNHEAASHYIALATDHLTPGKGQAIARQWMTRAYQSKVVLNDGLFDQFVQLAVQCMEDARAPVQAARFYYEEAIDCCFFGLYQTAHDFAIKALQEFQQRNMQVDVERTHQLLETINT